jgi:hypothetical protein
MLLGLALPLLASTPESGLPTVIGFSSLSGPNDSLYTGSVEGDFVLLPTGVNWRQGLMHGSPAPSIFVGPVGNPAPAALQITTGSGPFNFGSFEYSSNNGDSTYAIEGYFGSELRFRQTGTLFGTYAPFPFYTLLSEHPTDYLDSLYIQIIPGSVVTSVNLDNLQLTIVPEPGNLALLALAALALRRRFNA